MKPDDIELKSGCIGSWPNGLRSVAAQWKRSHPLGRIVGQRFAAFQSGTTLHFASRHLGSSKIVLALTLLGL